MTDDKQEKEEEVKKTEETPTDENTDDGDAPVEGKKSMIEEAREAAAEVKKERELMKAENDRREQLMSEEALGGTSEAGKPSTEKKETPREYAERILKGE